MKKDKEDHILFDMVKRFGGYPWLAGVLVCSVCRTVRDIGCAVTLAMTTDAVLTGGRVWYHIILMLIAMLANIPINTVYFYCEERYMGHVRNEAMKEMGAKLPKLPASWLGGTRTGELISTSTSDVDLFLKWTQAGCATLIQQITYYIGAICYALSQNVLLTVLAFPIVIVLVPLFGQISKPLKETMGIQRKQAAGAMAQMQEVLSDPEQIKAYGLEDAMEMRVGRALEEQMTAQQKSSIYQGLSQSIGNISSYLPGFAAAAVGVVFLMRGDVTAGFLVSFVQMAVQRFSGLIPKVASVSAITQQAKVAAGRICLFLDAPQEREDGEMSLPECSGEPVFEAVDVSFSYDKNEKVLDGVSFRVEPGSTTAFVGASGSGKSTILSLLMGVYEPDGGELRCMGRSVRDWNLKSLREQMAPVFQDAFLFPATVEENICGKSCDTEEERQRVHKALEDAGLTQAVQEMPEGVKTKVEERGSSVSGGQRQRMTIARAFYKDAPILLLDEPTSALDTVTEEQLQKTLARLQKGRTTVVVAHRLKTIREADCIYVLDRGRVVQTGTHEELFAVEGAYRRLYEAQAKEGQSDDWKMETILGTERS